MVIWYLSLYFLVVELSSNQSGSIMSAVHATYASLLDPSLTHQRALENSRSRSAASNSSSTTRDAPRDRAAREAHHRAVSGPPRSSDAYTWAFHWPSNVSSRHVSFNNQVFSQLFCCIFTIVYHASKLLSSLSDFY